MSLGPLGQFITDMIPAAQTLTLKETILAEPSPELLPPPQRVSCYLKVLISPVKSSTGTNYEAIP